MGDKSEIEWTDATWNPVTGCSKVSPGCAHCYAEGVADRFWAKQYRPIIGSSGTSLDTISTSHHEDYLANGFARPRKFTDVMCHEDRLDQPLRWRKPRRIFVNSMSDLFHEDVPDDFIAQMFVVMAEAKQHTFQVLTKRADRMRQLLMHDLPYEGPEWPLPNVWLGVSVENQRFADERIPLLLQTPAAVRFISAEPLLGPVDLTRIHTANGGQLNALGGTIVFSPHDASCGPSLNWVIVGGESGNGARPFDLAWARSIVQQCQTAGVPVFMKQLGAQAFEGEAESDWCGPQYFTHNKKGGDPSEWPADLRVRQFPEAGA